MAPRERDGGIVVDLDHTTKGISAVEGRQSKGQGPASRGPARLASNPATPAHCGTCPRLAEATDRPCERTSVCAVRACVRACRAVRAVLAAHAVCTVCACRAPPCRAVPCRAVPRRAVPCRAWHGVACVHAQVDACVCSCVHHVPKSTHVQVWWARVCAHMCACAHACVHKLVRALVVQGRG